jgi:hypothetical protein
MTVNICLNEQRPFSQSLDKVNPRIHERIYPEIVIKLFVKRISLVKFILLGVLSRQQPVCSMLPTLCAVCSGLPVILVSETVSGIQHSTPVSVIMGI